MARRYPFFYRVRCGYSPRCYRALTRRYTIEFQFTVLRDYQPGGRLIITVPANYVDHILHVLQMIRLMDAESFEEHHGFDPNRIPGIFKAPYFRLYYHERFELGMNNLYVFERI